MYPHPRRRGNLYRLFEENREYWDHDGVRSDARAAVHRALLCRTKNLGAEVYYSPSGEEHIFCHTCKSRACNSCGYWQTVHWQREVSSQLPEIPYVGVILTMHPDLWEIFRGNRHLLRALPALGAGALSDWAKEQYKAEIPILTVLHTFNAKLEFKPHLHIVAGLTGLRLDGNGLVTGIHFPKELILERWRNAVLDLLENAVRQDRFHSTMSGEWLLKIIAYQRTIWWKVIVGRKRDKEAILNYNARYLRRPPIGDYRILSFDRHFVRFQFKDKRDENRVHECELPTKEFISRLLDHIPDRRLHGVRYSGLLSPHSRHARFRTFLRLLGGLKPPKVRQMRWCTSLRQTFGTNPLLDSRGNRLTWSHRLPPVLIRTRARRE